MQDVNEKTTHSFAGILRFIAAISAVLAILCFLTPVVRKNGALRTTGEKTLAEMSAAATAIAYYSAEDIAALAAQPAVNTVYKKLAGLLSQYNTQFGYQKSYLLTRAEDKSMRYLVDGSYRDNASAGTDYYLFDAQYPLNAAYKPVKSSLDKIYSGKSTSGYTSELVTRSDLKKIAVACLPIYGAGHAVTAVLCIETDPGNTAYHMAGPVNLYYAGLILTAVFFACLLMLTLRKRYHEYRDAKQQAQKGFPEEEPVQNPQSDEAADAYDDTQTPDDNIDTMQ